MEMTKESWYLIKTTPGITGFIGRAAGRLRFQTMRSILLCAGLKIPETKPSPKIVFELGEAVRISEGPFANFNGSVMEIYPERGKLKVSVSILGAQPWLKWNIGKWRRFNMAKEVVAQISYVPAGQAILPGRPCSRPARC